MHHRTSRKVNNCQRPSENWNPEPQSNQPEFHSLKTVNEQTREILASEILNLMKQRIKNPRPTQDGKSNRRSDA
jgi:hypothetical protein